MGAEEEGEETKRMGARGRKERGWEERTDATEVIGH